MKNKTIIPFKIFFESLGLYFSNFFEFLKYMSFPVLGQIVGFILILVSSYIYINNMPNLIDKYSHLNNFNTLILIAILVTLPGLMLFCKAFWEYLIAYGSINSMYENMHKTGRVYDFDAHIELIKRRKFAFIRLWLLISCFTIIAICPLFWIICGILGIYFILVFQVFTFEQELKPIDCFKKSFLLIKGHLGTTALLLVLITTTTYVILPQIVLHISNYFNITTSLSKFIIPIISNLSEIQIAEFDMFQYTNIDIAKFIIELLFSQIIIQYTLPMRSILWSVWYKELNKDINSLDTTKSKKKSTKRPSEKLMESTRKKYSKKKIDDNILRRAMEKDDD